MPEIFVSGIWIPVRSDTRAELYREELTRAVDLFQSPSGKVARLGAAALVAPALLGALANILDELVVHLAATEISHLRLVSKTVKPTKDVQLWALENGLPLDLGARGDWYLEQLTTDGGVLAFRARNPRLMKSLALAAMQFAANVLDGCRRLVADLEDLETIFFPGCSIRKILSIEATGSDSHKGGKQVLIFELKTLTVRDRLSTARGATVKEVAQTTAREKLVYKPSDVELDYLLVGNSYRVERQPSGAGARYVPRESVSQFDWADRSDESTDPRLIAYEKPEDPVSLVEHVNALFKHDDYCLPTYRILPRAPGSLGADHELRESYGWLEFLSHAPALPDFTESPTPKSIASKTAPLCSGLKQLDWVTRSSFFVERYHRQCGRWMALATLFSITDLHQDNCIVHRCMPHLIDLESAIVGPIANIGLTVLPDALVRFSVDKSYSELSRIGLGIKLLWGASRNRLLDARVGTLSEPKHHVEAIEKEFLDTLSRVTTRPGRMELVSWAMQLERCIGRLVPMNTTELRSLCRGYHSELPPYANDEAASFREEQENAWCNAMQRRSEDPYRKWIKPNFALANAMVADIAEGDIPCFYHRLGSAALLDSRGARVAVNYDAVAIKLNDPAALKEVARDDYFPAATCGVIFDEMRRQVSMAEESVASFKKIFKSAFDAQATLVARYQGGEPIGYYDPIATGQPIRLSLTWDEENVELVSVRYRFADEVAAAYQAELKTVVPFAQPAKGEHAIVFCWLRGGGWRTVVAECIFASRGEKQPISLRGEFQVNGDRLG